MIAPRFLRSILLPLLGLLCVAQTTSAQFEVKAGWPYVDGEKFFLKCIGFETHTRPGQVPWVYSFDADLLAEDLARIKAAGFNTIRTWAALTEEELDVVEASGLKVLFGIWIDPLGAYGDDAFRLQALNEVRRVVRYTRRSPAVIGYLIMNEPPVEHIAATGPSELAALWQEAIDLLHEVHPGVPVSVSNTGIHDFVRTDLFDFAAYNAYIYNPFTITYSHGYGGFIDFLKTRRAADVPLVITEFGLSVSPGDTPLRYGYGGNTPDEQRDGNLLMYRGLLDGGAQGGCVFQHYDGWWKAGDENTHDPNPEEWFGLLHFDDGDPAGTPRPAWDAFATYNQAVITEPRNGGVYDRAVPVEFFPEPNVEAVRVLHGEEIVYEAEVASGHHAGAIQLPAADPVEDVELTFVFLDAQETPLKTETLSILNAPDTFRLPEFTFVVTPKPLAPGQRHEITVAFEGHPLFDIVDDRIDYVLHPHLGFDPGVHRTATAPASDEPWSTTESFVVPEATRVATFGAGLTVAYGTFTRRLYAQEILFDGDWADPIAYTATVTSFEAGASPGRYRVAESFPNPFTGSATIAFALPSPGPARLAVYDLRGREVAVLADGVLPAGRHEVRWEAGNAASGVYLYRLQTTERSAVGRMVLVR